MIDLKRTTEDLNIDISLLKKQSVKKIYWICDSCGLNKLKSYRDCLKSSGLCKKCNGIKSATMMGNRFGKMQKPTNKCLYCSTLIASKLKTCKAHNKEHLTKIRSGQNNPAWKGTNICSCGKRKATGSKACRSCSFLSGERNGSNNGRWIEDRGRIVSAKIARSVLSNTLKTLGVKKNGKTVKILQYTFAELKIHLESKFEPWMTWNNRGITKDRWSIDHIIPVSVLIQNGITDPSIINALWNLRPLRTSLNIKRSNNVDLEVVNLAKEKLDLDLKSNSV